MLLVSSISMTKNFTSFGENQFFLGIIRSNKSSI
jgi:hypothetical protein